MPIDTSIDICVPQPAFSMPCIEGAIFIFQPCQGRCRASVAAPKYLRAWWYAVQLYNVFVNDASLLLLMRS